MPDDNKHNLLFFEAPSMRELHAQLNDWQQQNRKRFLSVSVQPDGDLFCCIALTNPTEVVIVTGNYTSEAAVREGRLWVQS